MNKNTYRYEKIQCDYGTIIVKQAEGVELRPNCKIKRLSRSNKKEFDEYSKHKNK